MGFEIPVDVDYFDHPKTMKLIRLLSDPQADIYPLRLWKYCAKYARDGFVKGGRKEIETALKWSGRPGRLIKALVGAGFVESDEQTIHDWKSHIGRAILIYEEKKRKQRQKYAAAAGILPEENRQNSPNPGNSGNPGNPLPDVASPQGTPAPKIGFYIVSPKKRPCPNCGGTGVTVAGPCPGCVEGRALRRREE